MDVDANVALYTVLSSIRWLYDWRASDKKLKAADLEEASDNDSHAGLV